MTKPIDWDRVQRLHRYISTYIQQHHCAPSYDEMCLGAMISSKSVVRRDIERLIEDGLLERTPGIARGLSLPDRQRKSTIVSVFGTIAAGLPSQAGDPLEAVELPGDMLPAKTNQVYGLRVRGDSMRDALIDDGDLVIIQPQTEAHNGEMVAVRLADRDEYTLKRFYREGDRVRLQPANPAYEPIFAHPAHVQIQGRVVLVIRRP